MVLSTVRLNMQKDSFVNSSDSWTQKSFMSLISLLSFVIDVYGVVLTFYSRELKFRSIIHLLLTFGVVSMQKKCLIALHLLSVICRRHLVFNEAVGTWTKKRERRENEPTLVKTGFQDKKRKNYNTVRTWTCRASKLNYIHVRCWHHRSALRV